MPLYPGVTPLIEKLVNRHNRNIELILNQNLNSMFKTLAVNARFLSQPITGVQRYSLEISRALKKLYPSTIFYAPKNIIHGNFAKELQAIRVGNNVGHLWEQLDLPMRLHADSSPLLINLANTAPLFYRNKISTIHDVAFARFPKNFSWLFRSAYNIFIPIIIKSSRKVITVSEFSKNEICSLYGVPKKNVSIISNATSEVFTRSNAEISEKYLLAVSSISAQKNFHGLINAFSKVKRSDYKLYLIGSLNKNSRGTNIENIIKSDCRIKMLGRVTDSELVDLYSGATAFIYPSFYEGFGIPPLEAQACGCPVLVSRAASLPEVCENSAIYFDPYDTDDMADKIETILADSWLRERLRISGYENLKRFNWTQSAERLLKIATSL